MADDKVEETVEEEVAEVEDVELDGDEDEGMVSLADLTKAEERKPEDDEEEETETEEETESEEAGDEDETGEEEKEEGDEEEKEEEVVTASDLLKLQNKRLEDEREHFKTAHDRLAGKYGDEIGKLKRQLREGAERPREREEARHEYSEEREDHPTLQRVEARLRDLDARDARRAVDDADHAVALEGQAFSRKFEDAKAYQEPVMKALEEAWPSIQEAIADGNAELARTRTRGVMLESYYNARESEMQGRIAEAEERKAAQEDKHRTAKKLATPAGAGTRRSGPKPPKRPEEMTEAELETEYRRQGRPGF